MLMEVLINIKNNQIIQSVGKPTEHIFEKTSTFAFVKGQMISGVFEVISFKLVRIYTF